MKDQKILQKWQPRWDVPVEFSEGEGRHEWGFWDQWLPVMIDKMMKEDV